MIVLRLLAIGVAVVVLALSDVAGMGAPPVQAAFPGENGKIAFSDSGQIKTMDPDGSNIQTLGAGIGPNWSSGGGKIAFRRDIDGQTEVFVMNEDGTGETNLTNNAANDLQPAWSPDGEKIAFLSNRGGSYQVWAMNANGSAPQQITNFLLLDDNAQPSWSPDGTKILFGGINTPSGGYDLYTVSPDGSNVHNITNTPSEMDTTGIWHFEGQADWSPDGSKIVYLGVHEAGGSNDIYTVNADGSGRQRLTDDPLPDGRPAWSPEGDKIVFTHFTNPGYELVIMSENGSGKSPTGVNGIDADWQAIGGQCPGIAAAPAAATDDDTDGDNIPDNVENNVTHTDPNCQDTDGDGLLDPWEVPESVEGAGFDLDEDGDIEVTRDEVFGPYAGECGSEQSGPRREPLGQNCGLMFRPDPLHKDVYVEMDWQDCFLGDCPEPVINGAPLGIPLDPSHHAPSMLGLLDVVNMFRDAPVDNPDDTQGVNLNILVDEAIPHVHNCDQGTAEARATNFGTVQQRANANVIAAREMVFRYAWSGHSSLRDYSPNACPLPEFWEIIASGAGVHPLPEYDISPHGDATRGGRDILVTLAISWICQLYTFDNAPNANHTAPCFRQTIVQPAFIPGLFPAHIAQSNGGSVAVEAPMHMLLGLQPSEGVRQLWGRSFANLIGHSLGVAEGGVGNDPNTSGHAPVERYSSWSGAVYAPPSVQASALPMGDGVGVGILPDFSLAQQDGDADGSAEGEDNCPGVSNPGQSDLDVDGFGDDCDLDEDGDGLGDEDDSPRDTDNDGTGNDADTDDDGDGAPDGADNCALMANAGQENADGDALGNACDDDSDADGLPDVMEQAMGSDPLSEDNGPEFLGYEGTCGDGFDNDNDGDTDTSDSGCSDPDGDTVPALLDNCPLEPARNIGDSDNDGLGDVCEPPGDQRLWGDLECNGETSSRDNQALSRLVLAQAPLSQTQPCPALGSSVSVGGASHDWGDLDCDGEITSRDGQALLRRVLQQAALSQTQPCPPIGNVVSVVQSAALPGRWPLAW